MQSPGRACRLGASATVALVAACGLTAPAAQAAPAEQRSPATLARPLLPDLDQAAPFGVGVKRQGGRYVLAFGSAVANLGRGPLVIDGRRVSERPVMRARQVVVRTDGSRVFRGLGPILRYERAETHDHWHLHRFAVYTLRAAREPARVLRARKSGFCLGDRYDADPSRRLPGEPRRPRWTHDCGLAQPGLRRLHKGISVGWGDDYPPVLEGQYVDLTGLRAGRYVLTHRANPAGVLRELDYTNNAASVLLQLRRPPGAAPRVRVLARCPDKPRCPA